ncbi:glycophorin-C isoform X1 [Bos indicus x Bos taurus]|uniref:Glycophorin C n=1 Tax=Bos taurus TaxID=9913 RepID=Q2MJQ1_BOVIN|nr:PREDICTED: glycophorin-C isoform X1 [Bos indicus]XP_027418824.1 glycophorin-C isoform X1 [Bos indicus x Bos taurus]ABC58718.1 glycophorin C [Bos taurus]
MSTQLPLTTTQQGTETAAVMEIPLWSPEPNPGMASSEINIAVIAGVIAAMAFVLVGLLLLMLHYMYRHKGTYHTNEAKGTEFAESADVALQDDPSFQDNGGNSKKEYFI